MKELVVSTEQSSTLTVRHGNDALKIRLAKLDDQLKKDAKSVGLADLEKFHARNYLTAEALSRSWQRC